MLPMHVQYIILSDCIPGCVNGTCDMTVGECDCDDGYIGSDCSIGTYVNHLLYHQVLN